jgi:predicted DNA-binding WGR domain protein
VTLWIEDEDARPTYSVTVGAWEPNNRLVRNWGRIGTNGRELVEVFDSELEAGRALEAIARTKRRRGYRDL